MGRPLFQRPTEAETLLAIMAADVPDMASLRPDLHPRWEEIVRGATAHDPTARYATAREALEAFATLEDASSQSGSDEVAELAVWALTEGANLTPAAPVAMEDDSFREAPTRELGPRGPVAPTS